MLLREGAASPLARRLRGEGEPASIGETFSFVSGLYFRGKLSYAHTFAAPPPGVPGALVITPSRGLLPANTRMVVADLAEFASTLIDAADPRYRDPLRADAMELARQAAPETRFILLGSVATGKYVDVLEGIFADRLLFPADFVGRGDMSRGGLLLRASSAGDELRYIPVRGAERRGARPPRLQRGSHPPAFARAHSAVPPAARSATARRDGAAGRRGGSARRAARLLVEAVGLRSLGVGCDGCDRDEEEGEEKQVCAHSGPAGEGERNYIQDLPV